MNALAPATALRCELAQTERCRCRCGGQLHGRKAVASLEGLATLPADDPHHVARDRLEARERPKRRLVGVQTSLADDVPEKAVYARPGRRLELW